MLLINIYISADSCENEKNICLVTTKDDKREHAICIFRAASMQNLAGSALFLPQGGTHFQLVPLGSPQGYFMGKFSPLTNIKFLPPMTDIQK